MIPQVTESALSLEFLRADGFALEAPFTWGVLTGGMERRFATLRQPFQTGRTHRAMSTLPLNRAGVAALGHPSPYIQRRLATSRDVDQGRMVVL
jgi:hypothetical protein